MCGLILVALQIINCPVVFEGKLLLFSAPYSAENTINQD